MSHGNVLQPYTDCFSTTLAAVDLARGTLFRGVLSQMPSNIVDFHAFQPHFSTSPACRTSPSARRYSFSGNSSVSKSFVWFAFNHTRNTRSQLFPRSRAVQLLSAVVSSDIMASHDTKLESSIRCFDASLPDTHCPGGILFADAHRRLVTNPKVALFRHLLEKVTPVLLWQYIVQRALYQRNLSLGTVPTIHCCFHGPMTRETSPPSSYMFDLRHTTYHYVLRMLCTYRIKVTSGIREATPFAPY
jgi:hypothetical protein